MSFGMADRNKDDKLGPAYWSRMVDNPGYKMLKNMGYDFETGCGRDGQGMIRPLFMVPAWGTVSDRLQYQRDVKPKGEFVPRFEYDEDREVRHYVWWFRFVYKFFAECCYAVVPYDYRLKPMEFVPKSSQPENICADCGSAA